jgi:hypothetical protein
MKQLKIVSNNYDSLNGLIQVNFNEPITVVPGSTIAMDKFSMEVSNGVTDDINLGTQTVFINTNVNSPNANSSRGALIPSGTYTTISALLSTLNESFNSILDSDMTYTGNATPDNGLFFLNWLDTTVGKTSGFVTLGYGSAALDYTSANLSLNDMSLTGVGNANLLKITGTGSFSAISLLPVVKGALDIRFEINYASNTDNCDFFYGLFDTTTQQLIYGISKSDTSFYFTNNGKDTPVSLETYVVGHSDYQHQFYVEGGNLFYQILDNLGAKVYVSPRATFQGFNFNTAYDFGIAGDWDGGIGTDPEWIGVGAIYQPNISQDTFGIHWDYSSFTSPTYLKLFSLTGTPPLRTVQYDFEEASVLQFGLGFQSTQFDSGPGGAITSTAVADVAPSFEDFYNLALQIPSLQLESYVAETGGLGGRINNLCYFFPTLTGDTNKIFYTYENRELAFVELSNKFTINMNSMQFRIVYASDNSALVADAVSFNLYIKEPASL